MAGDPEDPAGAAPPMTRSRWWGHPVREHGWPLEMARLVADPVWRGIGVPPGLGRPVILIPGFMAGDSSMLTLANWLRRRGYRVSRSGIQWNVGCTQRYLDALSERLQAVADSTRRRVALVGHSRGGLIANSLANLYPDHVANVVTLGSPLADNFDISVWTSLAVAHARRMERIRHPESRGRGCLTEGCVCSFRREAFVKSPPGVRLTCVVTPDDGIVSPRACTVPDARVATVRGTHVGLVVNPQVYRILGDELPR